MCVKLNFSNKMSDKFKIMAVVIAILVHLSQTERTVGNDQVRCFLSSSKNASKSLKLNCTNIPTSELNKSPDTRVHSQKSSGFSLDDHRTFPRKMHAAQPLIKYNAYGNNNDLEIVQQRSKLHSSASVIVSNQTNGSRYRPRPTYENGIEVKSFERNRSSRKVVSRKVRSLQQDTHLQPHLVNNEGAQNVLDLLNQGDETTAYPFSENAVLVLGNTGAGKSTFTRYITGNSQNLISEEKGYGTEEFIVTDISGKIIGNSTITSFTTFPELVTDAKTAAVFYDCPGFSDTRSLAHDIAATYFTKKVIEKSKRVKLIFIVNYSSLRFGENRQDFMTLVKHATTMIKDIDKFNESIALIVTKVDTQYTKKGKFVADEKVIENIASFLREVRVEMKTKISRDGNSSSSEQFHEKVIKFIDTLLEREDGQYKKIGIFRRPDEPGPLKDIPLLQDGKKTLEKILYVNTQYKKHEKGDFGYTISPESLNSIYGLIDQIKNNIASDIVEASQEVESFYVKQEEKLYDLEALYDKLSTAHDTLAKTEKITNLRDFVKRLAEDIDDLKIDKWCKSLSSVVNYDHYLKFMMTFSGQHSLRQFEWIQGFNELVESLNGSQKWYSFLIKLFSILSEYPVQRDVNQYANSTNNLLQQIVEVEDQAQFIKSLKVFLDNVMQKDSEMEIDKISDVKLNEIKLTKLGLVLDLTLIPKVEVSQDLKGQLLVKGQFIKFSDVSKFLNDRVKVIQILALEKVFLDMDLNLTAKETQLLVVAPLWDIQGSPQIILDGAAGEAHRQIASQRYYRRLAEGPGSGRNTWIIHGGDGDPGHPGKPAGNFLGIGQTFVNSQHMSISAIGGRGGPGQNGRSGGRGADGTAPNELNTNYWWPEQHTCEGYALFYLFEKKCTVWGRDCTNGGNGGNGGIGGKGGKAGQIVVIALNNDDPKISLQMADGPNGADGEGGQYGRPGIPGKERTFLVNSFLPLKESWLNVESEEFDLPGCVSGESGITGTNKDGIQDSEVVELQRPFAVVNNLKSYLRENLHKSVRKSYLVDILQNLDDNEPVVKLYDTLGLIDEFKGLENQFHKLRIDVSFSPFYKSLLQKIGRCAQKSDLNGISRQTKKVLSYLYTATLSKIYSIDSNSAADLVVDIKMYLDSIKNEVATFKESKQIVLSDTYQQTYAESLKKKMADAQHFIDTKISADLNSLIREIDNEIETLMDETISLKNTADDERKTLNEQTIKLENAIVLKMFLGITKIATQFLGFAGPIGKMVQVYAERSIKVVETLALNDDGPEASNPIVSALPPVVNNFAAKIKNEFVHKKLFFMEQLHDAEQKINEFLGNQPSQNLEDIKEKVSEFQGEVQQEIDKGAHSTPALRSKMYEMRKQLFNIFDSKFKHLEKTHSKNKEENKEMLKLLTVLKNIMGIDNLSTDYYGPIRNDETKIQMIAKAMEKTETKIKELAEYEQKIYSVILPTIRNLEGGVKTTVKELKGKSGGFLDVSRWQIKSAIEDVKLMMNKMTRGFHVQENLAHYLDKLKEGMSTMIDIYNRIEHYHDSTELTALICDITSVSAMRIEVENTELKIAIADLQQIIQSNLVLQKYGIAVNAFKQYVFPFASSYSSIFRLPNSLKSNDTDALVLQAVNNIQSLQDFFLRSFSTINENQDKFIFRNASFSSSIHHLPPFFVWRHKSVKSVIAKLFEGKEIAIKANVRQGLNKNVVKFNEIGIRFNLVNETLQQELDERLQDFALTMTHLGNSYYKCENKFYVIPSEPQVIVYSFAGYISGDPVEKNFVYEKLKSHDPVLSPYAMWSFKLMSRNSRNFSALAGYKTQEIDIELEGRGQYMEVGVDVCADDLENNYELDSTIPEIQHEF